MNEPLALLFGCVALVFNPFDPVHLVKSAWVPIDILAAASYMMAGSLLRKGKAKRHNVEREYFPPSSHTFYPPYIVASCLIVWAAAFFYSVTSVLPLLTRDNLYVETIPCLDEYENAGCIEYGEPVYTPIGQAIKKKLLLTGIGAVVPSLIVGWCLMYEKRRKELENAE